MGVWGSLDYQQPLKYHTPNKKNGENGPFMGLAVKTFSTKLVISMIRQLGSYVLQK
jgi:hypothetical protein